MLIRCRLCAGLPCSFHPVTWGCVPWDQLPAPRGWCRLQTASLSFLHYISVFLDNYGEGQAGRGGSPMSSREHRSLSSMEIHRAEGTWAREH